MFVHIFAMNAVAPHSQLTWAEEGVGECALAIGYVLSVILLRLAQRARVRRCGSRSLTHWMSGWTTRNWLDRAFAAVARSCWTELSEPEKLPVQYCKSEISRHFASALAIISGNSLVFSTKMLTSTGF